MNIYEDESTETLSAECPLCEKVITVKISGTRKYYTLYCKECGSQLSIRQERGKNLFIEKYVVGDNENIDIDEYEEYTDENEESEIPAGLIAVCFGVIIFIIGYLKQR
ncbi:unnamed protein product [marine sediment metagenome]|uniref:Uncharacterized protein n=1 Tax=marine sediment metagenome TaxID=412755 RepID=X1MCL9_9ZZZZ